MSCYCMFLPVCLWLCVCVCVNMHIFPQCFPFCCVQFYKYCGLVPWVTHAVLHIIYSCIHFSCYKQLCIMFNWGKQIYFRNYLCNFFCLCLICISEIGLVFAVKLIPSLFREDENMILVDSIEVCFTFILFLSSFYYAVSNKKKLGGFFHFSWYSSGSHHLFYLLQISFKVFISRPVFKFFYIYIRQLDKLFLIVIF